MSSGVSTDSSVKMGVDGVRRAMNVALDWLYEHYRGAVETAISRKFSNRLGNGKFDQPWDVDPVPTLRELMGDWLLAEAVLGVHGHEDRAAEILLGPEGPPLTRRDREWLNALMNAPLGLYEVVKARTEGGGMLLRDLVSEDAPAIRVATDLAGHIQLWDVVGARLVLFEGEHRFSTRPFWVARHEVASLRDSARASFPGADAIIAHLLQFLYHPSGDEDDEDPADSPGFDFTAIEPLVVEFYRVKDWSRFIAIMAVEPGVQREGEFGGWMLVNSSPGPVNTFLGPFKGMLRSLSINRKTADESNARLNQHAGAWITRLKRTLVKLKEDPNPEPVEPLRKPMEIQADQEGYYRAWIDAPNFQLRGQSPRAALTDPEGCARVIDLVKSYENRELREAYFDETEPVDFGFLWQELGLDPSAT
ncbi:MAG TPA: hypothetical protein VN851_13590 [Thermoanaerobaculia bacterium]|nr:hypothetical protein [Thermoanaerobaculia bacterium]